MKVGIIGAGFTGLAAAHELLKKGHEITIFEKDTQPGGLAVGYQEKGWDWTLEKHYHHWFTNDTFVLKLAKEIGHEVLIRTPKSSFFIAGSPYQFDSPQAILSFSKLPIMDRLRMAGVFAILFRFNPFWKPLEKFEIDRVVPRLIGEKAYTMLWKPQLVNKMGKFAKDISLVWFWARIKKRTTSLAYPSGGFLSFAKSLVSTIEKKGGVIHFETEIEKLEQHERVEITVSQSGKKHSYVFDEVIVTLPSFLFLKIAPSLPQSYQNSLVKLQGLSATNLVLRLRKPFFSDNTYWLSICEPGAPIMAIIEHTNFMDKTHYNNEHIVYLGNYAFTHDKLNWDKNKILAEYTPFLKKINPDFEKNLIDYAFFTAPFAQPIVPANYSTMIPAMTTPFSRVFLANIEQVYPWDRGTNYAVELGKKVATLITNAK
ncbi:NAD(P)/FAD-dependent oxidoreductase [soil metagenome]